MTNEYVSTDEHYDKTNGEFVPRGIVGKTLSQLANQADRGAAVISHLSQCAADQIDRTAEYLVNAGRTTLDRAQDKSREIRESVRRNRVPWILAATAVAVGIGILIKRKRA
jgi:hypothetical protein